jgi:hypothetical protein
MTYMPPSPSSDFFKRPDKKRKEDDSRLDIRRRSHDEKEGHQKQGDKWIVEYKAPVSDKSGVVCAKSDDRLARIALDSGLDINFLKPIWRDTRVNVRAHLFDPETGMPRFAMSVDIWKSLLKAYFAWCCIPKKQCAHVWGDIVDMMLTVPAEYAPSPQFRAWAFECLGMFYLEDRKNPPAQPEKYDPEMNWHQ